MRERKRRESGEVGKVKKCKAFSIPLLHSKKNLLTPYWALIRQSSQEKLPLF